MGYDDIIGNIKGMPDHLQEMFSAAYMISALADAIEEWKERTPENMSLVVRMRTPEGKVMKVAVIKPVGFQSFMAVGAVDGNPHMVTGHIATLRVFCYFQPVTDDQEAIEFKIESIH